MEQGGANGVEEARRVGKETGSGGAPPVDAPRSLP